MTARLVLVDRSARRREARVFFEDTLSAVHCILTSLYRVAPAQAPELECYLSDWFEMFTTRPGIIQIPVASLRLPLLIAACRAGCIFALARLAEAKGDEDFKDFLRIDPQVVAEEIEEKLKLGLPPDAGWIKPKPGHATED